MTLSELLESDQAFVLPKDIAPVMGCNPQDIRLAARAGGLGFPVTFVGNRCKIPRIPFLRYIGAL